MANTSASKQILLLTQRRGKYNVPTNDEVEAIQRLAEDDLPPLEFAPEPVYPVLPAPLKGAELADLQSLFADEMQVSPS